MQRALLWCRATCLLRRGLTAAVLVLAVAFPARARAQETREAQIAAQQAAKAAALAPASLSKAERRFVTIKDNLVSPPSGFFPAFGSVLSGGGLAVGPGFRYVANDTTTLTATGLWSIRSYKQVDVAVDSHGLGGGLVSTRVGAGWKDAPRVAFYGIGSSPDVRLLPGEVAGDLDDHGRADFRMQQTWVGADLRVRPEGLFLMGGGLAYEHFDLSGGRSGHPSIEERFDETGAPGLGRDHTFVHTHGTVGLDWRPAAGYARRGGLYAVSLHNYQDTDGPFSFGRLDADIVQHVPVLRESLILSLRGRVQSTVGSDEVPFFLLPSLGGGSTLRGFSSFRFRDRHSVLLSAEYRWTPNRSALDAAIFVDAGKVTPRRRDLDFEGLKTSVGFGLRLHTPVSTPIRLEIARSSEGLRVIFASSAVF